MHCKRRSTAEGGGSRRPKQKPSRLNVERVGPATFRVTCKPKHDLAWVQFAPSQDDGANARRVNDVDIGTLVVAAMAAGYQIEASPFDQFILRAKKERRVEWASVPAKVRSLCFPYQRAGIEQSLSTMGGRHWFCDEMGLGKSMASIAVMASKHRAGQQTLVICPSYLRHNWSKEIGFWSDGGLSTCLIMKTKDTIPSDVDVVVISYDLAVRKIKELRETAWACAICDESHYLKSRNAKRTKALTRLLHTIARVYLLTGTPAMSRPAELYTQLHVLYPQTFRSFYDFGKRYADLKPNRWGGFDESGASNTTELSMLMQGCMIRRLKKNVLPDLPTKLREDVTISPSKSALKEFGPKFDQLRLLSVALQTASEGRARRLFNERQMLTSDLFRMTATAKIECVKAYVTGRIMGEHHKVLVWAHHQVLLDAIEDAVIACNVEFIKITGKTDQNKRQGMVDEFRTNPAKRVAILSLMACSTGLNFTPVAHAIFAELIWSPSVLAQAEDRLHRIGATEVCNYTYLIADGTLDAKIYTRIHEKFNTVDKIIDGGANSRGFDSLTTSSFVQASSPASSPHSQLRSLKDVESQLRRLGVKRFVKEFAGVLQTTLSESTTTLAAFLKDHGHEVPLEEVDGLALRSKSDDGVAVGAWEELVVGKSYKAVKVITEIGVDEESLLDFIQGVTERSPQFVLGFGLVAQVKR